MNTTDRELLKIAAKAAGIELQWPLDGRAGAYLAGGWWKDSEEWNPLTNDGDALRLAVKLSLFPINFASIDGGQELIEVYFGDGSVLEPTASDLNDAIRRAITRAAAEIGKEMK